MNTVVCAREGWPPWWPTPQASSASGVTAPSGFSGYTSADAVGQSIADLIIPEPLWDLHEAGLRRLARDGTSPRLGGTYTMPARDAANRYFPVDLTLFPIPVPDGTWIVGVMRPTTDDTSTSTTPTQDVVLSIFERAPEAITILDPLGRQINVNAAGAAMMGYNEGDQHAADGHAFIHPDDRDRTARHMADVVAGTIAPSTPCRYRVLAGDGRWVWLETLMADLIDVPGINAYAALHANVTQDEARRTEPKWPDDRPKKPAHDSIAWHRNDSPSPPASLTSCSPRSRRFPARSNPCSRMTPPSPKTDLTTSGSSDGTPAD